MYRLLYAHTAMPVSRLCAALVSYKSEFEHLKRKVEPHSPFSLWNEPHLCRRSPYSLCKVASSEHLTAQSTQLNMYIWDFAVALWRQKLFASDTSPHAKRQYKDTLGLTEYASSLHDCPLLAHPPSCAQ